MSRMCSSCRVVLEWLRRRVEDDLIRGNHVKMQIGLFRLLDVLAKVQTSSIIARSCSRGVRGRTMTDSRGSHSKGVAHD